MAITNYDGIVRVLANGVRVRWDVANIANTVAGQTHSLWRGTGQPGQAATPTTAAVCDKTLTGAIQFPNRTSPTLNYLPILEAFGSTAGSSLLIYDRLMQMGGLSGTVTTAQTVNLDLDANLATSNLTERIGDSDYSDVEWFAEWYTDTGSTAANLTVNVTYNDGTSSNLTPVSLAATRRASFMQPLNYLIPSADAGKRIRDINTATLSVSTGTAGNFGFTAARYRAGLNLPLANTLYTQDFAQLGLPVIYNDSCLFAAVIVGTTSTGLVRATGKIGYE